MISEQALIPNNICVVCQHTDISYAFQIKNGTFLQCDNCRIILSTPKSTSSPIINFSKNAIDRDPVALAKLVLNTLTERSAKPPYLVLSTSTDTTLVKNFKKSLPSSTSYLNTLDIFQDKKYSTIIILTPLSMIKDLNIFFHQLKELMTPNGLLVFIQPMLDSSQAKLMKHRWLEWQEPHMFYPTRDTLHILMLNNGFDRVWFCKARYPYTLAYIHYRLKNAREGIMPHALAILCLPFLRKIKFRLPSSHIVTSCQLASVKTEQTLSIVLPVYNEKNTFEDLMKALLAKKIEGVRKQIIIVESNSTDGTRDLVKKYAEHPDVHIIWQERARGKGFAVREGLAAAMGEYVLIQDADLEYDVNDYEMLLAPLRANQCMFVLGSRHSGSWKIREFNDAAATAAVFNVGHVFFTWFINFLTRQKMADPFTMFKVLRRDAFFGLRFTCKRFDFDHEMVIKLIRKGYQPLELPVNYKARSFAEGKKVSFIKDGLTWVYTDLKLRFGKLGRWSS